MDYRKQQRFQVVALRDMEQYLPNPLPNDPVLETPFLGPPNMKMVLPTEMEDTRAEMGYWLINMIQFHHYTWEEVEKVSGLGANVLGGRAQEMELDASPLPE